MNRTSWLLLAMLLATNAAWLLFGGAPDAPPERAPGADPPTDPTQSRRLERENADLRRKLREIDARSARETPPVPASSEGVAPKVVALRDAWVRDALQVRSPALRVRALEEIRAAVAGGDETSFLAALAALPLIEEAISVDFNPLEPQVVRLLLSETPAVRLAALRALAVLDPAEGDFNLIALLTRDPSKEIRAAAARNLRSFREQPEPLLALLDDPEAAVVVAAIESLGNSGREHVRDRLLAVAREADIPVRCTAILTLGDRWRDSEPLVDELLRQLEDPDPEVREAAADVLYQHGGHGGKIADAAARIFERAELTEDLGIALGLICTYGSERHLPALERAAENAMAPRWWRDHSRDAIERIRTSRKR